MVYLRGYLIDLITSLLSFAGYLDTDFDKLIRYDLSNLIGLIYFYYIFI